MNNHFTVKIYGERNTGTNYLSKLISLNFSNLALLPGGHPEQRWPFNSTCRGSDLIRELWHFLSFSKNLGWKHTAIQHRKFASAFQRFPALSIVFVVKNPYSWLLSLHHRPYHSPESLNRPLADFLATRWKPLIREHVGEVMESPAALWNFKVKSYVECLDYAPASIIRYEDLLTDPCAVLLGLSETFGWKMNTSLMNVTASTKGDSKNFDHYRDYYLNERWRESLSVDVIDQINMYLDKKIVSDLGYKVIL